MLHNLKARCVSKSPLCTPGIYKREKNKTPSSIQTQATCWRTPNNPFTSKLLNSDLSTMDELDETQLKNHVDSLKQQLQFNREKTSVSLPELTKWIEEKMNEDPFLNPDILKDNPWVESSKCVII
ncbi:guanine nucleotide-binding protein G(I)/G(S)/G(O) subunit gamma-13-like [Sinocyclocheilus rhinocerous]|nr:PREDICTED: guanine nucleotide-binding protein G(I)/G(S)/G(O) subunit gamma-13-like [Sinocyclocheilus rhinocerous]